MNVVYERSYSYIGSASLNNAATRAVDAHPHRTSWTRRQGGKHLPGCALEGMWPEPLPNALCFKTVHSQAPAWQPYGYKATSPCTRSHHSRHQLYVNAPAQHRPHDYHHRHQHLPPLQLLQVPCMCTGAASSARSGTTCCSSAQGGSARSGTHGLTLNLTPLAHPQWHRLGCYR